MKSNSDEAIFDWCSLNPKYYDLTDVFFFPFSKCSASTFMLPSISICSACLLVLWPYTAQALPPKQIVIGYLCKKKFTKHVFPKEKHKDIFSLVV